MTATTFKVGDRVRIKSRDKSGFITSISIFESVTYYRLDGAESGWNANSLEQVISTDAELADKYRALRTEAKVISDELVKRGYKQQWNVTTDTYWRDWNSSYTYGFRFVKTETKETIL